MELELEINNFIEKNQSIEKASFDSSIIKTSLKIYGVKTNLLRKEAKRIAKLNSNDLPLHQSYEMDFIIGVSKAYAKIDLLEKLNFYEQFFIGVDNWAIVDGVGTSLNLKDNDFFDIKKFIEKNINSEHIFLVRFCYILLLHNYVKKEYLEYIISLIKEEAPYYILMIEAWLLATCFLIDKELILEYLKKINKNGCLFKFTKRKLLDSLRVSEIDKVSLRSLK